MKSLYRWFLVVMILMIAFGVVIFLRGVSEHGQRPVVPRMPGGQASLRIPSQSEIRQAVNHV